MKSQIKQKTQLNALVIYEGNTYTFPIDKNSKFEDFANFLIANFSLDSSKVQIKYKGKLLNINDQRLIGKIINNSTQPKFEISNTPLQMYQISASLPKLPISESYIVKLTNYYSSDLVMSQVISFYNKKNMQNLTKITSKEKDTLKLSFPNYQYAEEFVVFFKYIISSNPILNQTKVELVKTAGETKTTSFKSNTADSRKNKFNILNSFSTESVTTNPRSTKSKHKSKFSFSTTPTEPDYHRLKYARNLKDEAFINNYFSQQMYIRNASPYLSEEDKYLQNYLKDKKKWINQKGFFTSVGKYSMKYNVISNYVAKEPSENPLNHKFRLVNKKKWITEKGFC